MSSRLDRLDRRQFLRALGLGAAALPFVPLLDAHAASTPPPRRLVFFFNANGTIRESWLPKMVAGKLELSPIRAPLEKFKSKLLVIDGLSHKVIIEKSDRDGHTAGMNTALTGRNNKILDPKRPLHSMGTGISVDQHLADLIGAKSKLRSLECGVQVEPYSKEFAALSYRGSLQPILPENSPYRVFDRLFRNFTAPGAADSAAEREALADRQRVLEAVSLDLEAMRGRLPQSDRIKMEAHISSVRAIEHSMVTGVGAASGSACKKPELGAPIDVWKNENIPAVARLQMDMMAMALACDLTRVGTIQFGRAGAPHRFMWLGKEFGTDPIVGPACQAKGFHALAHREVDADSRAKLVRIHVWYAQQLAYFLEKLASIPEAGGTMLDNTAVVWLNELGTGGDHSHRNTPWVIAGNAGGFFKTGQLASFPGEPHNRLLLSLCHAMGVNTEVFGDADYCKSGALTGISA
jgi:hypothetical protein